MEYFIEPVKDATQNEMVEFLLKHEDFSLFLLGNYEAHGFRLSDAPNSGNYMIIRQEGEVVCVFCLTRRGNLLITAKEGNHKLYEQVLKSCKNGLLRGVLGDWKICAPFWDFLKGKQIIKSESFISKEVLYSTEHLDLMPNTDSRLLRKEDYLEWRILRGDYLRETKLPSDLSEEQTKEQFYWQVERRFSWALFQNGEMASIADLNAKALHLGQLGGVYTTPKFRNRGLGKALVQKVMQDCHTLHGLRKMIIFTDEDNLAARKLYESLHVNRVGEFALLFGN